MAFARASLLNDAPHTSNDADFLKQNAAGYAGDTPYQASPSAISPGRLIAAPGTAPANFTTAAFEGADLPKETLAQFKGMMAAEHT